MNGQAATTDTPAAQARAYGLLGLPLAFVALPVYVHVPHVYAQQHGQSLAWLGFVLLLSRALDALADPWLGRWADRLYRRSWQAVWAAAMGLAVAVAAGFAALFFPPMALLPSAAILVWVGAALVLSHVAYSGLGILHQSWAVRQGGGGVAQSRWVAWREGWALLGLLLATALPTLWGWPLTLAFLVLALGAGLWAWHHARRSRLQAAGSLAPDALAPQPDLGAARPWLPWAHGAFRRLLLVFVLNGLASAVPATLLLFFVQDVVQAPKAMGPAFLGLYFAAGALSFPLWLWVIGRVGLRRTWAASMALSVAAFVGVLAVGAGDSAGFLWVCALSGLALGADLIVPSALLNQCIDRLGQRGRTEGLFLGWWHLATKMNLALAAGLALPLLALWGYAPGVQDAPAVQALALAYGLLPCVLKLAAALALYVGLMRPSVVVDSPESLS